MKPQSASRPVRAAARTMGATATFAAATKPIRALPNPCQPASCFLFSHCGLRPPKPSWSCRTTAISSCTGWKQTKTFQFGGRGLMCCWVNLLRFRCYPVAIWWWVTQRVKSFGGWVRTGPGLRVQCCGSLMGRMASFVWWRAGPVLRVFGRRELAPVKWRLTMFYNRGHSLSFSAVQSWVNERTIPTVKQPLTITCAVKFNVYPKYKVLVALESSSLCLRHEAR